MYKNNEQCLICFGDTGVKITLFCCGTLIHPDCLNRYQQTQSNCPTCRQPLAHTTSPVHLLAWILLSYAKQDILGVSIPFNVCFQTILEWIKTKGYNNVIRDIKETLETPNQQAVAQRFPDFPYPIIESTDSPWSKLCNYIARIDDHRQVIKYLNDKKNSRALELGPLQLNIQEALKFCQENPVTNDHLRTLKQLFPMQPLEEAGGKPKPSSLHAGIGSFALSSVGINLSAPEYQSVIPWLYIISLLFYYYLFRYSLFNYFGDVGATQVLFSQFPKVPHGNTIALKNAVGHHCGTPDPTTDKIVVDDSCVNALVDEAKQKYAEFFPYDPGIHLPANIAFFLMVHTLEILVRSMVRTPTPSSSLKSCLPIGMIIIWVMVFYSR